MAVKLFYGKENGIPPENQVTTQLQKNLASDCHLKLNTSGYLILEYIFPYMYLLKYPVLN